MPLDVPARSYSLADGEGDGVDAAGLVAKLGERLDIETEPPTSLAATVFDTADRRVRDAGGELRLEPATGSSPGTSPGARTATNGARLVLRERPGSPPLAADVPRARRYLATDLPPGRLRDRLADVVEMRALLPLVRLAVETQPVRVRNRDEKTVVRLAVTATTAIELPAPATGSTPITLVGPDVVTGPVAGPVPLAPRVEVAGVLGYARPLARVETLLGDELGLSDVTSGPADQAVAALGGDPSGIRSKVRVDLRPDERTDAAAVAVLDDLAGMVDTNLQGTIDDLDTEFLHDLRVAIRRSRSVLREMKGAFRPEPLREQREALRWIQAITGPTRDLDVQLLDWDELVARLPDGGQGRQDRRATLAPVHDLVARHRAEAFRTLRRHLVGDEYDRVWKAYRAFLAEAGAGDTPADAAPDAPEPIARVAGRRIRRVYARMLQMGGAIDDTSPAEALHDLRKRGKELRYLLELFGGLWPAETVKPMVRTLKGLQDVLGRHQDREVQADSMRALAPELTGVPGGADALLSLGVLVERLEREQHEARAHFAESFAAFSAPAQQTVVDETCRAAR
jgi:CHAD domain-containing protein